jgi:hypothetical protein
MTEYIGGNRNPNFEKSYRLTFLFEKIQKLRFVLWDHSDENEPDLIGDFETNVGSIMGSN